MYRLTLDGGEPNHIRRCKASSKEYNYREHIKADGVRGKYLLKVRPISTEDLVVCNISKSTGFRKSLMLIGSITQKYYIREHVYMRRHCTTSTYLSPTAIYAPTVRGGIVCLIWVRCARGNTVGVTSGILTHSIISSR